jgi:hypothetical protein
MGVTNPRLLLSLVVIYPIYFVVKHPLKMSSLTSAALRQLELITAAQGSLACQSLAYLLARDLQAGQP